MELIISQETETETDTSNVLQNENEYDDAMQPTSEVQDIKDVKEF